MSPKRIPYGSSSFNVFRVWRESPLTLENSSGGFIHEFILLSFPHEVQFLLNLRFFA